MTYQFVAGALVSPTLAFGELSDEKKFAPKIVTETAPSLGIFVGIVEEIRAVSYENDCVADCPDI